MTAVGSDGGVGRHAGSGPMAAVGSGMVWGAACWFGSDGSGWFRKGVGRHAGSGPMTAVGRPWIKCRGGWSNAGSHDEAQPVASVLALDVPHREHIRQHVIKRVQACAGVCERMQACAGVCKRASVQLVQAWKHDGTWTRLTAHATLQAPPSLCICVHACMCAEHMDACVS